MKLKLFDMIIGINGGGGGGYETCGETSSSITVLEGEAMNPQLDFNIISCLV